MPLPEGRLGDRPGYRDGCDIDAVLGPDDAAIATVTAMELPSAGVRLESFT
jgi:hypothetical protein